jgi:hypothetical protein
VGKPGWTPADAVGRRQPRGVDQVDAPVARPVAGLDRFAGRTVGRNVTRAERTTYFPSPEYRATFPYRPVPKWGIGNRFDRDTWLGPPRASRLDRYEVGEFSRSTKAPGTEADSNQVGLNHFRQGLRKNAMRAFASYVNDLECLLEQALVSPRKDGVDDRIGAALDGQPGSELRRLVGLEDQRAAGAFFTGSVLAERAVGPIAETLDSRSVILDPACGAGDLLLAAAKLLPSRRDMDLRLAFWSDQLIGRDPHPEFVRAAKLRLTLAALDRSSSPRILRTLDADRLFPQITPGCGLSDPDIFSRASHIVINPPFTTSPAPVGCQWASGGVSMAAQFMDVCLRHAREGTRIVAILPEVLRSGERYRKWRSWLEDRARIQRVELLGQFDRWADIDVFALELVVSRPGEGMPSGWMYPSRLITRSVAEYFDVSVGRVVPYRDPEEGRYYRYVHARILKPWGQDSKAREHRRHPSEGLRPPFVVVRRTSRAGQAHRAVGTIISGDSPVAVENHLLVLLPKDGGLASCRRLMGVLRSPRTDEWFDQRIRCRHLTVTAMRQLPWWPEER